MPPKRRRRHQGLYYHSSPPKVLSMIGSQSGNLRREDGIKDGFVIKPSNIRIWIHDKDVRKLTKVMWAGEGNRLRSETSTNPKMRKFLENVPYVLNVIKDVHQAVINNDLDTLKQKTKSPVPLNLLKTKDLNGLSVMHKAAGLGHTSIIEYLLNIWPEGATELDLTGKTPLHWAVSAKNNQRIYNLLVQAGATEDILDNRMKTALDYKQKPSELDRSLLTVVPDAPRVPHASQPDWSLLSDDVSRSSTIKSGKNYRDANHIQYGPSNVISNGMNLLTTRSRGNSIDKISEPETIEEGINNNVHNDHLINDNIITQNTRNFVNNDYNNDNNVDDVDNVNEHNNAADATIMNGNYNNEMMMDNNKQNLIDVNNDDDDDDEKLINSNNIDAQSDLNLSEKADDNTNINDDDDDDHDDGNVDVDNDDDDNKGGDDDGNHDDKNNDLIVNGNKNYNGDDDGNDGSDQDKNQINLNVENDDNTDDNNNNNNNNNNDENLIENENDKVNVSELNKDNLNEDNNETENDIENKNENIDTNNTDVNLSDNQEDMNIDNNEYDSLENEITTNKINSEDQIKTYNADDDDDNNDDDEEKLVTNDDNNNELNKTEINDNEQNAITLNNINGKISDLEKDILNETQNNGDIINNDKNQKLNENELIKSENLSPTVLEMNNNTEDINNNNNKNGNKNNEIVTTDDNNNNKNNKNVKIENSNNEENLNDKYDKDDINNNNKKYKGKPESLSDGENNDNTEDEDDDDDDDDQENVKNMKFIKNHNDTLLNDLEDNIKNSKESSPSQPLEISGLVQGGPDDNQVQSQSEGFKDNIDIKEVNRIQQIIDSGDMEQLAAIVLNGEGKKIINAKSSQPEIQAFLDNVQNYMNKIRRVHQAAKDGNLRDLQSALDRRKFAIAKDEISPDGASPLHVATVFGHAAIIRYLGGRFPETTNVTDDNGRTSLHYAATINDNGHFYNLLTHLGANPNLKDKFGYSPEYYKNNETAKNILSYKTLLKKFGANEQLEEEMLNDQDEKIRNNQNLDIPLFRTEQGQYLSNTLGDPLVKGLTEITEKRPSDPVAYLANFLINFNKSKSNKPQKQVERRPDTPIISRPAPPKTPVVAQEQVITSKMSEVQNENSTPEQIPTVQELELETNEKDESSPTTDEIPDSAEPAYEDRDEHGQSMLHFACARAHSRNALYHLINDSQINIAYRDELYRTARDVSLQASQVANAKEIDRYVLTLAARGELKAFDNLILDGYDHILDIIDDEGNSVIDVARSRGHAELTKFLSELHAFEESREELHLAIREKDFDKVQELTALADSYRLIRAKNYYGRNAIHIAVLKENEDIIEYLANICPVALRVGDNLERMPLHYAMGVNLVETLSRILIKKGAKRAVKDLKGRQPSYYFMNKADILRLQDEEDEEH